LTSKGCIQILGILGEEFDEEPQERALPALDVRMWMRETLEFLEDLSPIYNGLEESSLFNAKAVYLQQLCHHVTFVHAR
jgi:hypothetical protein